MCSETKFSHMQVRFSGVIRP